jgi:serine/threonine protein kinase
MTHQLVFGNIYFIGNDQWLIKKECLRLTPKQKESVSSEFYDFVSKCLIKDKNNRLKASELCNHPVFKKVR